MTATEIIREFQQKGVQFQVCGDRLRYAPREAVTPDMRQVLKDNKWDIIAHLTQRCPTCGEQLRITLADRYHYEECPSQPIHYFRLTNQCPAHPMGVFTEYKARDQCRDCHKRSETYNDLCEECIMRLDDATWYDREF